MKFLAETHNCFLNQVFAKSVCQRTMLEPKVTETLFVIAKDTICIF